MLEGINRRPPRIRAFNKRKRLHYHPEYISSLISQRERSPRGASRRHAPRSLSNRRCAREKGQAVEARLGARWVIRGHVVGVLAGLEIGAEGLAFVEGGSHEKDRAEHVLVLIAQIVPVPGS